MVPFPEGKEVLQEQRSECRSALMRAKRAQQDRTIQLSGAQISTKRPFRSIGPAPTVLEAGERATARAQG